MLEVIHTDKGPAAIGPYSQAIKAGGFVYVSGQLPFVPETGELLEGTVAQKCAQAAKNIAAILEAAGSGMDKVVKTTVFLTDLADFAEVNAEYAKHFVSNPARECVQVAALPKGSVLEISVIAEAESFSTTSPWLVAPRGFVHSGVPCPHAPRHGDFHILNPRFSRCLLGPGLDNDVCRSVFLGHHRARVGACAYCGACHSWPHCARDSVLAACRRASRPAYGKRHRCRPDHLVHFRTGPGLPLSACGF